MYICTWKFVYLTKQCCLFEAFLPQMLDVILSISKCITMPFILKGVPHFCSWLTYKLLTPFSSLPSIPGAAFILSKRHLLYTRKSSGFYHFTCFDENIISMSETTAIANRIKKFRVWNPSKGRGVLGAYTPSLGVRHKIIWKKGDNCYFLRHL